MVTGNRSEICAEPGCWRVSGTATYCIKHQVKNIGNMNMIPNKDAKCGSPECPHPPVFGIIEGKLSKLYCKAHGDVLRKRITETPDSSLLNPNNSVITNSVRKGINKDNLLKMRARLNAKADTLLLNKGNDYNAQQQEAGDTLFNLRICAILGVVPSPVDGILVRMGDKFARLVSLTRPSVTQKVSDESLEDTVVDLRNYADYLLAFIKEAKGEEIA